MNGFQEQRLSQQSARSAKARIGTNHDKPQKRKDAKWFENKSITNTRPPGKRGEREDHENENTSIERKSWL